jgi:hypothetical protein
LAVSAANAKFQKETWAELIKFPWKDFKDPVLKRKFLLSSHLGNAALSVEDFTRV